MLPEIACEELGLVLDTTVLELLAEAGWERPPIDALAVASRLGITVALDDGQQGRARLVRLADYRGGDSHTAVMLRSDPRPERRQWAVAHELGECYAWRVYQALGVDPAEAPAGSREVVANHLAGRLLLPGPWLADDGRACDWDLRELKNRYATASHELIARRMLDFAPPIIVTIVDQERNTFRRSNVRGRAPALSPVERECWRLTHQTNEPHEQQESMRRVRAWPVHEPGWKREILRTELEEEGWEG
jgi:Zn-dependent peptidase ImmA (M78 family)